MYGEHTVFNVGRTFLSDHFAGRNARVTLLMPKRLTLGVAVANLAGNQTIKMAFPQFAELWKLIDLLVRKDFRQANLASSDVISHNTKERIIGNANSTTHLEVNGYLFLYHLLG